MSLDTTRNSAYGRAIESCVTSDSVVLDVGSGLGILGLIAARSGARRVYLVEPSPVLEVARQIAELNNFDCEIILLRGKIEEVELPERVDIILSVFTGNFLFSEDLLPSLYYARDRYLKPDGVMIPDRARMEACPVSAEDFFYTNIGSWSEPQAGIDCSSARNYAGNEILYPDRGVVDLEFLAEPATLTELDLTKTHVANCELKSEITINCAGTCHGWTGWISIRLGNHWLVTSPRAPEVHWTPVFLPLDPPRAVATGDTMRFKVTRPQGGDWTWRVESGDHKWEKSTFFSRPRSLADIRRAAPEFQPALSEEGAACTFVLGLFDGKRDNLEIAEKLRDKFPGQFLTSDQAFAFVRRMIGKFAS